MEVIVRIIKTNPWTGITKWPTCFDYVGSYWTRSGNRYTGLTEEQQDVQKKNWLIRKENSLQIVIIGRHSHVRLVKKI